MAHQTASRFDQCGILELMGHVRLAARLTEEKHFSRKMGRMDISVPSGQMTTQFFRGGAVSGLTPTTEEIARVILVPSQTEPDHPWELRLLAAQGDSEGGSEENDYEDEEPRDP